MADTLPSQEMAIAYVQHIESKYTEFPKTVIKSVALEGDEGEQTWRIVTNNGDWTVWQRADGTIYGEF